MKTRIAGNSLISGNTYTMDFEWDGAALPGQFVMIRAGETIDPLLRRPMSVAGLENGRMRIVYKVVGKGTAMLAGKVPGDVIDVDGPYGNGFSPPPPGVETVLIGGGVGIPPLRFFASRNRDLKLTCIIGGATSSDIVLSDEISDYCGRVIVATEDGSRGVKGLATLPFMELDSVRNGMAHVIACGPRGMLKAVEVACETLGLKGEVSTEEKMGCGFGVCLGCMVETVEKRKRVCVEGPVFKMGVIKWR